MDEFQKKKKKHQSPHFKKRPGNLSDSISDDEGADGKALKGQQMNSPRSALSDNVRALRSQSALKYDNKSDNEINTNNLKASIQTDYDRYDKKEMDAE